MSKQFWTLKSEFERNKNLNFECQNSFDTQKWVWTKQKLNLNGQNSIKYLKKSFEEKKFEFESKTKFWHAKINLKAQKWVLMKQKP